MARCSRCDFPIKKGWKSCENCGKEIKNKRIAVAPILITLLFIVSGAYYYYAQFLCNFPIHYSVGEVDPRFNVSRTQLIDSANEAANLWDSATGKKMFVYDENSLIKINLVYDERQSNLDKLNKDMAQIDNANQSITNMNDRLDKMLADYQTDLDTYNAKLAEFNTEVGKWNAQGGVPLSEFDRLTNTQTELETTRKSLNARRDKINELVKLLNVEANNYNNDLGKVKNYLDENKGKIITSGLYYPTEKKIDIFTFGDLKELRLLLTHEMGHSLKIAHDGVPTSIMYPVLSEQNLENPKPTAEDVGLICQVCLIKF